MGKQKQLQQLDKTLQLFEGQFLHTVGKNSHYVERTKTKELLKTLAKKARNLAIPFESKYASSEIWLLSSFLANEFAELFHIIDLKRPYDQIIDNILSHLKLLQLPDANTMSTRDSCKFVYSPLESGGNSPLSEQTSPRPGTPSPRGHSLNWLTKSNSSPRRSRRLTQGETPVTSYRASVNYSELSSSYSPSSKRSIARKFRHSQSSLDEYSDIVRSNSFPSLDSIWSPLTELQIEPVIVQLANIQSNKKDWLDTLQSDEYEKFLKICSNYRSMLNTIESFETGVLFYTNTNGQLNDENPDNFYRNLSEEIRELVVQRCEEIEVLCQDLTQDFIYLEKKLYTYIFVGSLRIREWLEEQLK